MRISDWSSDVCSSDLPVTVLGSREPGGSSGSIPRRGASIEMVYGEPFRTESVAWPRTREQVVESTLLLREHMLAQLEQALALTGRQLPGPLPTGRSEEHTSELQSLMRISYAVFCLKKKTHKHTLQYAILIKWKQ